MKNIDASANNKAFLGRSDGQGLGNVTGEFPGDKTKMLCQSDMKGCCDIPSVIRGGYMAFTLHAAQKKARIVS